MPEHAEVFGSRRLDASATGCHRFQEPVQTTRTDVALDSAPFTTDSIRQDGGSTSQGHDTDVATCVSATPRAVRVLSPSTFSEPPCSPRKVPQSRRPMRQLAAALPPRHTKGLPWHTFCTTTLGRRTRAIRYGARRWRSKPYDALQADNSAHPRSASLPQRRS